MSVTTRIRREYLPDPWIPHWPYDELRAFHGASALANSTFVAAGNDAHYLPVVFPSDATLYALRFIGGNATGNYDLGFYNADFTRLASKGSTALAASIQELTLPEIRVRGGCLYYAALSLSSTSGQVIRYGYGLTSSINNLRGVGHFMEASALPLPATGTPVQTTLYGAPAVFAFGIR